MGHIKNFSFRTLLIVLLALVGLGLAIVTAAAGVDEDAALLKASNFQRQVNGVYFVIADFGGTFVPLLITVQQDGLISSSSAVQGTTLSGDAFTDDQGVWKRTGPRRIAGRLLSFNYQPPGADPTFPDGTPVSHAEAIIRIQFNADFSAIVSGTFDVRNFDLADSPLDSNAVPLVEFGATFVGGQRLTASDL